LKSRGERCSDLDVLFFAEDPGAANFVAPLISPLIEAGVYPGVFAAGLAESRFRRAGIKFDPVSRYSSAQDCLEETRPALVAVGTATNQDTYGLALIESARKAGVPSIGMVDLPVNAETRFRGRTSDPLAYAPDFLLVPDSYTAEAYYRLGVPSECVAVLGHPHFDHVRAAREEFLTVDREELRMCHFTGAKLKDRIVLFATEGSARISPPPKGYPHEYTLAGRGHAPGRTELILEEFLDAVSGLAEKPFLVLRIHPKDTPHDYAQYLKEFDAISQGGDALSLIHASDLVVGLSSMLLLEATLLGVRTLSILPRGVERDRLLTIAAGITPCVMSRGELGPILSKLIKPDSPTPDAEVLGRLPLNCVGQITSLLLDRLGAAKE